MKNRPFSLPGFLVALSLLALVAVAPAADSWYTTDYQAALEQAAKENKPVFLEFTGTKWCPPCQMMERDTFDKKAFQEFAKKNLVSVKIDVMPDGRSVVASAQKQNAELLSKYQIQAFPTFVLLNPQGKEIAREMGYMHGGPEGFIAWVKKSL